MSALSIAFYEIADAAAIFFSFVGLIKAVVCVGGMLSTVSAFGVKTLPPVFAPRVHDVRRSAPSLKLQPPGVSVFTLFFSCEIISVFKSSYRIHPIHLFYLLSLL
jgi:hypothetical protein